MKKIYFFIFLISTNPLLGQEFKGCGEYAFKGVLMLDSTAPLQMSYIVHQSTKSEMTFFIINQEDILKLNSFLKVPTALQAKILKKMDGTKGEIIGLTKISRRFPAPLGYPETELKLLKTLDCARE